jgi:CDP-diacylglycerol---glycerol-3-phosphate 3-phosphatidyltransferase
LDGFNRGEINILQKEVSKDKLEGIRRRLARHFTVPVISVLAQTGISPNAVTWLGFLFTLVAAGLAAYGYLLAAGLTSLFAALFDMLDGALARQTNKVTRFGGVLDSTLDRVSEGAMLLGILIWYLRATDTAPVIAVSLTGVTLILSYLVSYIRARAEGAGLECKVGISTRPERVILTAIGLIFNLVTPVLVIIALMSLITVWQRLYSVWQQTKKDN